MEFYNIINEEYINFLKNPTVKYKFKVELMDYQENVIQVITQDISDQDSGSISINYQQGVRRSCSLTLINTFGQFTPNVNGNIWINTKFKVYIGVECPKFYIKNIKANILANSVEYLQYKPETNIADEENVAYANDPLIKEENIYWFSQGVFILTNPNVFRDKSKKTITLNGVDKFGIFGSETNLHETEGVYLVPAETTVKNVIKDILLLDIGNGMSIDSKEPIIDSSIANLKLPYDIKKSPNSYFADILIELGNVFACDIYYDVEGHLHFEKGNESRNMENYSAIWKYTDVLPDYFTPSLNFDFTNVYNVIKVIGNNAEAENIYTTILKNDLPSSPTRIQLIGEKIKYIESSFCYNQARTEDFAKYLLRKYSIVQNSLSFQSSIIPHLEVNNIINISDKYYNYDNQRFVIQSLTIPLSTKALISIQASNTANIPYFEY